VLGELHEIQGLGEPAYFEPSASQMFAYKRGTKVTLGFGGKRDAAAIEAGQRELMAKILGRL
jgi:hypothetical protein